MRITGRLNSYTLALLAVILVGIFTLAPSIQIWYEQRQEIADFKAPGEVSFLVMDADGIDVSDTSGTVGAMLAEKRKRSGFSAEVLASKRNWVDSFLESALRAGLEQPNQEIKSATN